MESSTAQSFLVHRHKIGQPYSSESDWVAVEEPMEIRVEGRSLAVVMRTPGHDAELTAGFLLTENMIQRASDVFEISACPSQTQGNSNIMDVLLTQQNQDWAQFTRHVFTSSSCGICGKATLDAIHQQISPLNADWQIPIGLLHSLPDQLRAAQTTFDRTGGLHASALFDQNGKLLIVREDVGRHNALDKVLGHALLQDWLPLNKHVLVVSGRISFELAQKALIAGIGLIAAVSAPSSLAVQLAERSGMTLVGFLRGQTCNIYTHPHRLHS